MGHECAHCGNTLGFTSPTCSACGWNEETKCFRWIRVWDPQDPVLTAEHANRTRDSLRARPRPESERAADSRAGRVVTISRRVIA
jgi:hypothetical protein